MDFSYYINGMIKVWKLQNKSLKTIEHYKGHLRRYLEHFKGFPETITKEQRWDYFLTFSHVSHRNQAMAVIRQLHAHLLEQPIPWQQLPYGKKPETLPVYFTEAEVKTLLNHIANPKQKCIAALQYLLGLRVSEVCNLRVTDFTRTKDECGKELIFVRITGKGSKQREVPLPADALTYLRAYQASLRSKPINYLFPGQYGGAYSSRSIQKVIDRAKKAAGLQHKECSTHGLRHAAATIRINKLNWDLRQVQVFLGHKNSKTTERYTHVATSDMAQLPQPSI